MPEFHKGGTMSSTALAPVVTIDAEFRDLIIPPSPAERELLTASIKAQGCLEPLYIWKMDDGQRILLDGHTRFSICTELNRRYETRNVKVNSREEAKLWILEHQAGRRNLTDDQRAIVWNEIREQRSIVIRVKQLEAARQVKVEPVSVKITETPKPTSVTVAPKIDTRAATAKEAKIPENKLRQAQVLKKHQPELYKKVLAGEIKLRETTKLTKPAPKKERFTEADLYSRVGRTLHNLLKHNDLSQRLQEISHIKTNEWCPQAEAGIKRLLLNIEEVQQQIADHRTVLKNVLNLTGVRRVEQKSSLPNRRSECRKSPAPSS